MVDNEHGRNLKVMRLTDAEYRAWMSGVLAIASKADVRGAFMVGSTPADATDVVNQSPKTSRRVAESLLRKLRDWKMLEDDDELGAEWVHDWDELNPSPKADPSNAKRQADWRARNANRNGTHNATRNGESNAAGNADVTPLKVEGEVEDPPNPPDGGPSVRYAGKPVPATTLRAALRIVEVFNDQAGTTYEPFAGDGSPSENLKRVIGAVGRWPAITEDVAGRMIRTSLAAPFWGDARPHLGHVFGPGVVEQNLQNAAGPAPDDTVKRKLLDGQQQGERLTALLAAEAGDQAGDVA